MNEERWLMLNNIEPLLTFAAEHANGRRATLFGCACCRCAQDWSLPPLESKALEATERHADGEITRRTWLKHGRTLEAKDSRWSRTATEWERKFRDAVTQLFNDSAHWPIPLDRGALGEYELLELSEDELLELDEEFDSEHHERLQLFYGSAFWQIPHTLIRAVKEVSSDEYTTAFEGKLCSALRDIFGNPFRPVSFSPEWRTDTAVALARTMYESRDFSAMPILADALQEAGCDGDAVLTHCRDTGQVHVRGCWVVDLVLGKE
jgi:hypothetical protein